jgi:RNA polymerase sigma-54 factor
MLENKSDDNQATRDYVKEKLRSALWLIKSVDQRQKTIYKVANSIVRQQNEFLEHGVEHLRPMVLRDVATDIGMHESTVSRVVSNKYMHTPQGVYEMRYFFHSGIASVGGEHVSSVTIKQRIRKIVGEENPKRPLSDSKIVKISRRRSGLARRTIAKYRESCDPPSNQRKNLYSSPSRRERRPGLRAVDPDYRATHRGPPSSPSSISACRSSRSTSTGSPTST